MMKKLAIALAVGTAALMGGSVASAGDMPAKARTSTDVTQSDVTQSSTDISAHRRYRHWRHHHWGHHHWGHHHYRPYYNSYGYYAPRRYGYYGGGPGVTFSFGTGGYRW